jgi:WD40 repeat protein
MQRHPYLRPILILTLLAAVSLAPQQAAGQIRREIVLPNRGGQHGMCPVFTPNSNTLLWWDGKGIALWDLQQQKVVGSIEPANWTFVLSPEGTKLATDMMLSDEKGKTEYVIKIYDIATRKELHQLVRPAGGDGKKAVFRTCGFDATATKLFTRNEADLQVWDVKTGKLLRHLARPKPPFDNGSAQSPDGRYLTIEDGQAAVHVLDTQAETILSIHTSKDDLGVVLGKPKGGYVSSLGSWSFSGDGKTLYGTCQLNKVLLRWSLPHGKMIDGVKIAGLLFAKVSHDTTRILATYSDNRKILRVLDAKSKEVLSTLGPMERDVSWYAISPDNRWVFASSVGDTRLWDLGEQGGPPKK